MPTENELLDATARGDIHQVRNLLDEGIDPNTQGDSGWAPIHQAAKEGNYELAELLLEYGCDPNAKEDSGLTSLHYAAREGHDLTVQLLLDYWADPNAQDKSECTPLHYASENGHVRIVRLLFGYDNILKEEKSSGLAYARPLFPIIINGNTLDQSTKAAANASNTDYILVQSWAGLSPLEQQDLYQEGVVVQDYVSKNTYLCNYKAHDLDKIRQMDRVVFVDIYRVGLKMSPRLKAAKPNTTYVIDVIFHKDIRAGSTQLKNIISKLERLGATNIQHFTHKLRLAIHGRDLHEVALSDVTCSIEEVGERELRNNHARVILGADESGGSMPAQELAYTGKGQVIAIADTGFDKGDAHDVHDAFNGRVLQVYPMDGNPQDPDGHGTHVCGSAVGDGWTSDNTHIMGTAPGAKLVVQCVGERVDRVPGDLNQLFEPPYEQHMARVHSNSWGAKMKGEQQEYTTAAGEIDNFVWTHPKMVICWAAGNKGTCDRQTEIFVRGQIRGEAAAKNCITVGASENDRPNLDVRYGYPDRYSQAISSRRQAMNKSSVAAFSSRGPTQENRPKPDVVAPGTCILSTSPRNASISSSELVDPVRYWHYSGGTSTSTPLVAGCAAVLREALLKKRAQDPSAALIKALLVNGADILSPPVPNADSGFGRVNLQESITIACGKEGTGFLEASLIDGDKASFPNKTIRVGAQRTTIKVTLVWTDPPGKEIINSLFLAVQHGAREYRGINTNNVQQVICDGIPSGEVTISVKPRRSLHISPQPVALVWRLKEKKDVVVR